MLNVTRLLCGDRASTDAASVTTAAHRTTCPTKAERPVVSWAVTQADNLPPVGAIADATHEPLPGELTFTDGLRLLSDLRGFDVPMLTLTGGEPLLRDDLPDLLEHASEIRLPVTLFTNGTLLDDAAVDRLVALNVRSVGIAIDGAEQRHDKLHATPGAFSRAMAAVDRCKGRGLHVGVRFAIHQYNHMDLDAVFDLCVDRGIERLAIHHLVGSSYGALRDVALTPAQTRDVVDRVLARTIATHDAGRPLEVLTAGNHSDAGYMLTKLERTDPQRFHEVRRVLAAAGGNRSGATIASIDPLGGVHYDESSWHYTCGNVRERPFSAIWGAPTDPRLVLLRDRYDHLPDRCQVCRFVGLCNGNSRTRAEAATGDWLACDPACYMHEADVGLSVPSECVVPDLHAERMVHATVRQDTL